MKFTRTLRPLSLTAVIFFTVSGGPYGLEPLLNAVGPTWALVLLIVIPLVWSVPAILVVLELNGLMQMEGGYYQWVKSALGPRWGFYEGWWTWLFTMTDLAIYPVLFVTYLAYFIPEAETFKLPICLAIIWGCTALNLRGVVTVGRSSVMLGAAVLLPFVVLFIAALLPHESGVSSAHSHAPSIALLGLGIFNAMWNYLGWDNATTITEEVQSPARSYLVAIFSALAIIVGMYLLSMLTAVIAGIDPRVLEEEGFPALGNLVGGWWLGGVLSAGGMASALGLFLAILLTISRIPKVMADDRFLPAPFSKLHRTTEVPHVSLIVCSLVASVMVLWSFGELLIIDVTLYSAALFPEFISLLVLRRTRRDAPRPFRIPLEHRGLVALTFLPVSCVIIAMAAIVVSGSVHYTAVLVAICAVASGPLMWRVVGRRNGINE